MDNIRRNIISGTLVKKAEALRDPSVLDSMPPELMTPQTEVAFAEAKQNILAAQHTEDAWKRQDETYQRRGRHAADRGRHGFATAFR
jgi:hypothetical protein